MSLIPLWAKALVVAALLALASWAVHTYNESLREDGRQERQADWDADNAQKVLELAAFNEESRRIEQRRQSIATEAQNAAQSQIQLARKDAADTRLAAGGLRDDLAAARAQLASATDAARAKYSAAVDTVFTDCTRRYSEMAEAAQGHAIDSLMLQRAWPK